MTRLIAWVAAAALLSACGKKELVIESNTTWSGTIERIGTVTGRYSTRYELDVKDQVCYTFTKTSSYGVLRVYTIDDTWLGLGSEVDGDDFTTEPNGQVQGCTQ
jgi:hypothetical protein